MTQTVRILIQGTGDTSAGVQLPDAVVEALGKGKKPPVKATINGYTWRSTVAVMGGEYWLGVSKEVRRNAGCEAGQEVDLTLELDTEERVLEVPADFAAALDAEPEARRFFDSLSYSNRRRFTYSIDDAKTPETRQRRIEKSVAQLREGKA
jgi:Bacteriocin-protection, YdeI or OmpD-Associated/Domain of unknown function (DUF1905)